MRRGAAWVGLAVALVVGLWPREARLSGPVTLEGRTRHVSVRLVSGPSIQFTSSDDEGRHHAGERERLAPELARLHAALEAALAHAGVRVLPYEPAAELEWGQLVSEAERDLATVAYSPYARRLLRRAAARGPRALAPEWDIIRARPFVVVFSYAHAEGGVEVRVRVAAGTGRATLARLDALWTRVLRPPLRPLRLPGVAADVPGALRTRHVQVQVLAGDGAELARRVSRRLEAEIAAVPDGAAGPFDRLFRFALRKGGTRVEATPVGGGFTSPYLAEIAPQIELDVTLLTVESDGGGPLDLALRARMFEVVRSEVRGLLRLDLPDTLERLDPDGWVFVQR